MASHEGILSVRKRYTDLAQEEGTGRTRQTLAESMWTSRRDSARFRGFEELSSQEFQKRNETNEIYIPPGDRLGDLVIDVKACARLTAIGCSSRP